MCYKMKSTILFLFSLAVLTMTNEEFPNKKLLDSNNIFTAKMFTEVAKSKPGQSVVLSAFSVLPPLAQLALASVGESHDELLAAIEMPNDNVTKAVFSKANTQLKSVKGVTLKTASKIYVSKNYEVNSAFADLSRHIFGSQIANIDFSEPQQAAQKVNQWVESQTNDRIKDLVDPLSLNSNTKALLVNAIYFKGKWEIPFNKNATSDRDFHVSKENVVQVPTMYNSNTYKYIDSEKLDAQVLELKYQGGDSALYVVLPHEVDGIEALKSKLKDPSLLDNVISDMYQSKVDVYLPKFKIETTINLKQVLQNLHVTKLFTPDKAGLDNLLKASGHFYINDATQKAFIEVNEEGSEAAAANIFNIFGTDPNIPLTPRFVADRPFYFVVKERTLTLFTGVYAGN